ncbi:MAG: hypothetical protein ACXVB9_19280 [Bdellovibrionota bacterium]
MRFSALAFLALLTCGCAHAQMDGSVRDYNSYVLDAVKSLPAGGKYSQSHDATANLGKSIYADHGLIKENPLVASPVYCSGASYQAFIDVIGRLQEQGVIRLSDEAVNGLLVNFQPDGTDYWGRWNANGPGTARAFYELNLGQNSMDWADAKPGDFMKIFFTDQIGKLEHGHSVVYLGSFQKDGVDYFRYWSSDPPLGRGTLEMIKSHAVRVIFSRLQHPENLNNIPSMPKSDPYTASLLTTPSTVEEMRKMIGL